MPHHAVRVQHGSRVGVRRCPQPCLVEKVVDVHEEGRAGFLELHSIKVLTVSSPDDCHVLVRGVCQSGELPDEECRHIHATEPTLRSAQGRFRVDLHQEVLHRPALSLRNQSVTEPIKQPKSLPWRAALC